MININALRSMTESGLGFFGGACTDELPHLSLTEAINTLSVEIVENQMISEATTQKTNSIMLESVMSAVSTGGAVDTDALVEMTIGDVKTKIKSFFDRIINFLKSIVAKLGMAIDKIRMSGKQLYSKYKDSKHLQKDFKGLEVNGYKFAKSLGSSFSAASSFESAPENLIKAAIGKAISPEAFQDAYKDELKAGSTGEKKAQKLIDGLKDIEKGERVVRMVKALTGEGGLSKDSWKADLKKKLYGDDSKTTLKYGSDFTKDEVFKLLADPVDLDHIKDEYNRIKTAAEKHKTESERAVENINKGYFDKNESQQNGVTVVTAYWNAYIGVIQDSYDAINGVKAIKYNACKDQAAQAKTIFGKMLSWSDKKGKNEDADMEDELAAIEFESEF